MAETTPPTPRPWIPYALPMAVFLGLTMLEGYLPKTASGSPRADWYPWVYAVKIAAVAATMVACRSTWRDLAHRPVPLGWVAAVGIGLLVAAGWVALDGLYPKFGASDARAAFDPTALAVPGRYAFLAVRVLGLVVIVPVFEELFWRSFLLRWVIDPDDFRRVPIGTVTPLAALASAGLFATAHPEWLPALLTGLAWAGLLRQTRSLLACVVSHMVANLGIGVYVLATHDWKFW